MRPIFALVILLAWPLAEIAGFVLVGSVIGVGWTLALVILTSLLGAFLMRSQGLHLLRTLSQQSQQGQVPPSSLIDGAMIVVAGILLLLPGFLTDLIGLALFVPFVRRFLWTIIGRRIVIIGSASRTGRRRGPDNGSEPPKGSSGGADKVVDLDEGEFHRTSNGKPSSPWSKGIDRDRD
ncbi:FxsA family protein [Neorhizobium sp. NCHU2750]|uniref:FxsA family protein n=1 Tax=Neorhizobium sp. NCHU2750 TaxID=1825976 RepID=UPI000E74AF20|nr:exclusion suppressor [Neorhizobium sp. NCHU2750]